MNYNPIYRMHAVWIFLTVVLADQITKVLIRINMELYESRPIIGDLLRLSYVENDGAAFSISLPNPAYNRLFFVSFSLLAIAFIMYLLLNSRNRIQVVAFGLVLGGAVGNLIDRIRFGRVTDFIDVDFPDFIMHRWPVFNIADSAIVIAMLLMVYEIFFVKDHEALDSKDKNDIQTENSLTQG